MKKLLIALAVLLLIGTGYFTYDKWVKYSDITSWSFIPADAAIVFEIDLLKDYNTLKGYPIWINLSETKSFQKINASISFLDSINGGGGFSAIFKEAPVLISMHKIAKEDLDFLFVLDIQNISQNTFVGATIGRLKEQGYRFKTRNYNGFKISEISYDGQLFTCIFYKNFLLASFTPYLVEDAIRTIEGEQAPFEPKFNQNDQTTPQDLLTIHANHGQISNLLTGVANQPIDLPLIDGTYRAQVDSSFITISGFSSAKGWLSTHTEQASDFDMVEVIPQHAAYVYHIASTDIANWKANQAEFISRNESKTKSFRDSLQRTYDFNADQIFDLIDEEIGIVQLESSSSRDNNRLCILELKNTEGALEFLSNLSYRVASARGDSLYSEAYSENEIRYLPIRNFPQSFLGELATGFDQSFYINHRNYLIIANNLQELKSLIASIKNEDTWGKSLQMNAFFQRANNTANLSLVINIPRANKILQSNLSTAWSAHFENYRSVYQNFDLAAFQFSLLEDQYFTNITLGQPTVRKKSVPKTSPETGLRFASDLISKPFLIRTHAHREFDLIVQDSSHAIYYLDQNQNTLWSKQIEEPIVSNVFPIDYYRNGKLQYLFATGKQVYMCDRNGELIPDYPKTISNVEIAQLNLIDYDLSRNYRIAITGTTGNVYLTDKDLNALEGWNPRNFERPASTPLNHKRIGRRDIMITMQENGVVNITNRRGNFVSGFPFSTNQTLDTNYFLRSSNSLSNSSLTIVSSSGVLTELNLEGDVIQRDQLIKTQADARFQLIPDRNGRSFLLVRKEGNTYQVLDDTGNLLFAKDYFSEQPITIQYYDFGAGKDLVVFTDSGTESLFIYDKTGNLVTGNPLKSAHEVSILYSGANREFQVFTTWGSNLERYTFSY